MSRRTSASGDLASRNCWTILRSSSCSSEKAKFTAECLLDRPVKCHARADWEHGCRHPALRGLPGRDPQGRGGSRGQQRVRPALQGDGRRRAPRRRQRARPPARPVPRAGRAHGARDPRPLGPHPGRSRRARGRLRGRRHRRGRGDARRLRLPARGRVRHRGRPAAAAHHPDARATRPARCASASRARPCCSAATPSSPAVPATPSFPGGDFDRIIESIDRRLFTLPADTLVLPGHGDDTTIEHERPHLQEWIDRGW